MFRGERASSKLHYDRWKKRAEREREMVYIDSVIAGASKAVPRFRDSSAGPH